MKVETTFSSLSGSLSVPGSKSHTIRACIFAALAEGVSRIRNPLASEDCLSCISSIREFGAQAELASGVWTIRGAGKAPGKTLHLPENVVDVGNSGSVLYFLAPVAAVFDGYSVFTGDESIRTRPVMHMADALIQLGKVL